MSRTLPAIQPSEFNRILKRRSPVPLSPAALVLLYGHYVALRKWSARVALIGPGTLEEVLDRHYGESLDALPWLDAFLEDALPEAPEEAPAGEGMATTHGSVIDVGSGAGFPGAVLGLARPGLEVTLVESRTRKCAFLASSIRSAQAVCAARADAGDSHARDALAALSVRVVNARIEDPLPADLPASFDVVTSRAVRLSPGLLEPLIARQPRARFLLWLGVDPTPPTPLVAMRTRRLEGSHGRFLVEAAVHHHVENDTHR